MRLLEFAALALRNLRGYALRSLLTTLGVVFGIASVVTMMALGRGAEEQILRQIDKLGITNVILNSVKPPEDTSANTERSWMSKYGLLFSDHEQILATVPGIVRALPVHSYSERAWEGSRKEDVLVLGVTPEYFDATKMRIARGRGLTAADEQDRRAVAVIHQQLVRALGHFGDPLGYELRIGEQIYEVVGIVEDEEFQGLIRKALASPERRENQVYVPYSTVLTRIGTASFTRRSGQFEATDIELNQVIVEVEKQQDVLPVAHMLRTLLERFHENRDYEMVVPLELLEQRRQYQAVFNIALLLIAGISLLVGGIGIANIMLATVTERTREIGVRRAIGAKRRHIMSQFLIETVMLSSAGGLLGVVAGYGGTLLMEWYTGWEAHFTPDVAVWALVVSCAVGILSGLFPAWRASHLDPIQALRYE